MILTSALVCVLSNIIKQFSDTTWVSYDSTVTLPAESVRSAMLRAQSHKTAYPPSPSGVSKFMSPVLLTIWL